jgi:hypothetical protein
MLTERPAQRGPRGELRPRPALTTPEERNAFNDWLLVAACALVAAVAAWSLCHG